MGIGGVVKLADFGELGRLGGAQAQLADACSAPEVLRKVPPPLLAPAQTPRPVSLSHTHIPVAPEVLRNVPRPTPPGQPRDEGHPPPSHTVRPPPHPRQR